MKPPLKLALFVVLAMTAGGAFIGAVTHANPSPPERPQHQQHRSS